MGASQSNEVAQTAGKQQRGAQGQQPQQPKQNAAPAADPGFKSCHLRGVLPSQALLEKEAKILGPFCVSGAFPQPADAKRPSVDLDRFPQVLADQCRKYRVSLQDMQALMLPPWGLSWGMAFPSKAELFAFLGREPSPGCLGELMDLEISGSCLNVPDEGMTIRTGRWAELIDGIAVVRLMSGRSPAVMRTWADSGTIRFALESLRKVRWSPDLQWAFPLEYQRRVVFLCCLGRRLKKYPMWQVVMSFVVSLSNDEMQAATWGMRRPGQALEYYSKTNGGWMPCRVVATDPTCDTIMLDIKPNYWLGPAEQASHTRAVGTAETAARATSGRVSSSSSRTADAPLAVKDAGRERPQQ